MESEKNNSNLMFVAVALVLGLVLGVGGYMAVGTLIDDSNPTYSNNNTNNSNNDGTVSVSNSTDGYSTTGGDVSVSNTVATQNIYQYIKSNPDLSSFAAAIDAAELNEGLASADFNLTVLVPTNAAFTQVSAQVDALKSNSDKQGLRTLLLNHYILRNIPSTQFVNNESIVMLGAGTVKVQSDPSGLYFSDSAGKKALVTKADQKATNGVVHIVDKVLFTN